MKTLLALLLILRVAVHAEGFDMLQQELADNRRDQEDMQEALKILRENEKNIQERIRKLTESCDKTRGVSPICPVHKVKMEKAKLPFAYGLFAKELADEVRSTQFPFAQDFIRAGCVQSNHSPRHGLAYRCKRCVKAEKQWRAR